MGNGEIVKSDNLIGIFAPNGSLVASMTIDSFINLVNHAYRQNPNVGIGIRNAARQAKAKQYGK